MKTTTSKDGTKIAYDVYGSGPVLISITGAGCFRTMSQVTRDAKVFAKEFNVYNYDRRGRGDSGDTLPYAPEREVEDIEALIDAAGGRAHLYGHSSGAVLALEAALQLGSKVEKVVIYDPSYAHDETEKADYAQLGQRIKTLLETGDRSKAMTSFLKGIGIPKPFIWLLRLSPDWKTMTTLAPTLLYDIALTRDLPPIEKLAKIGVPVLLMTGGKSPDTIHGTARQIAGAIPDVQRVELTSQNHMPNPALVLPELVKFLKK